MKCIEKIMTILDHTIKEDSTNIRFLYLQVMLQFIFKHKNKITFLEKIIESQKAQLPQSEVLKNFFLCFNEQSLRNDNNLLSCLLKNRLLIAIYKGILQYNLCTKSSDLFSIFVDGHHGKKGLTRALTFLRECNKIDNLDDLISAIWNYLKNPKNGNFNDDSFRPLLIGELNKSNFLIDRKDSLKTIEERLTHLQIAINVWRQDQDKNSIQEEDKASIM